MKHPVLAAFLLLVTIIGSVQAAAQGADSYPPITPENVTDLSLVGSTQLETVMGAAWSPDSQTFAVYESIFDQPQILLYDAYHPDSQPIRFADGVDIGWSLAFSPDGSLLAFGSGHVPLLDVATGAIHPFTGAENRPTTALAFSPDGTVLAVTSPEPENVLQLWDVAGGTLLHESPLNGSSAADVVFSPDGRLVATAGTDSHDVQLWNTATGAAVTTLTGYAGAVWGLAFTPDGRYLAAGGVGGTIRLWDVETHETVRTFQHESEAMPDATPSTEPTPFYTGAVWDLAISPDGRILAEGGWGGMLRLWDLATGQALGGLLADDPNPRNASDQPIVQNVWFSPDGTMLAALGIHQTLRFWAVDTAP